MNRSGFLFVSILLFVSVFSITNLSQTVEGRPVISSSRVYQNSRISTTQYENHSYLEINSDEELSNIASMEGWDGDGSAENPYLVQNYLFNNASVNPSTAESIKTSISYTYGGFSSYDLILNGIESFVNIQNNNFTHAVLISQSTHINLIGNNWINGSNPYNLMISSHGVNVTQNIFSGIDSNCNQTSNRPTPRVYITGRGINIFRNRFTLDTGCYPIQNIVIISPPPEAYTLEDILIYANLFETSDLAITASSSDVYIYNNDFAVGDFAVSLPGGGVSVNNNNFILSLIGTQGQQSYYENVAYFVFHYFNKDTEDPTSNSYYFDTSNKIDGNFYSSLVSPDADGDGIVDNPLQYGKNPSRYDYNPSTKEFPGYIDYNETTIDPVGSGSISNSNGSKAGYDTIMVLGITIPTLLVLDIIKCRKLV